MDATQEAGQLAERRAARGAQYRQMGEAFDSAVDPQAFTAQTARLRADLDTAMRTPEAMNDKVLAALEDAAKKIDKYGEDFTPAHLRALRVELASKLDPSTPLRAAPRDSPAILSLVRGIDNTLDASGGGRYSPINSAYREASAGVDASRAAQQVRNTFLDPVTGLSRKTSLDALGEVPTITQSGLQAAFDATNTPQMTSRLSQGARGALDETMAAIRAQDIGKRVNRAATQGGGSATATNMTALAQEEARAALLNRVASSGTLGKMAVGTVRAVDAVLTGKRDALIAEASQDPQRMAALLRTLEGASPEVRQSFIQQLRQGLGNVAARGGTGAAVLGGADVLAPENY
jgi:hypothetical protein